MGRLRAFITSIVPRFVRSQSIVPRCSLHHVADVANTVVQHARAASPDKQLTLTDGQIDELVHAVTTMNPEDLAIHKQRFVDEATQCDDFNSVVFVPVLENENCTIAVFVIPPGRTIPLHDHPHMYVVSRVLWGQLQLNAYDIFPADSASLASGHIFARERAMQVVPADHVKMLTPTSGNVHSFAASEWTAVFDVLLPPYDSEQQRDCTYYDVLRPDQSQQHDQADVILKETPCPNSFNTVASEYIGVQIN